jgi:hypothetical protein
VGAAIAALFIFSLFFFIRVNQNTGKSLVWLTPTEMTKAQQPGPLTRLKYQVLRLTGPLGRWLPRNPTSVLIDSQFIAASANAAPISELQVPPMTNAKGQRAWVISADSLKHLREGLKDRPGILVLSRPRIQTADGGEAGILIGGSVLVGSNSIPVGLSVNVQPKVTGDAFQLLLGITASEAVTAPEAGADRVRTNFAMACRALVPNAGALVLQGAKPTEPNATNYWFIISSVVVDAKGKPITRKVSR